jgi:effector-binding domain-containing protein
MPEHCGVTNYDIQARTIEAELPTAVVCGTTDVAGMPAFLGHAFETTAAYLTRNGVGPAGMPYARYQVLGEGRFDVEAGFPATTPVPGQDDVEPSSLPAGPAAVTVHVGPYDEVSAAYEALTAWVAERGEVAGAPWEVYLSEPDADPPSTEIWLPYRPR